MDEEDRSDWYPGRASFKYVLAAACLKCLSFDLQLYKKGVAGSPVFETFYFNDGYVLQKLEAELAKEMKKVWGAN